jgi:hypothetical protein
MNVAELPKQTKLTEYVVLLKNGKTLEITAEVFDTLLAGEDYVPVLYRFYRSKKIILELEASDIKMIADKNEVNIEQLIAAVKYKLYRRKRREQA